VIHAGIYYPPGSLKAELCVAGRDALYARCERFGVPHRRTGKLIVATSQREVAALEALRERGTANGAPGLELIDASEVALALSFAAEAEAAGALFAYRTEVVAIERAAGAYAVRARGEAGRLESLPCAAVVNAGGLGSDRLAALAGLDVDARGYRLHLCKGDYFSLAPAASVRVERPVYPVPSGPGLGIHASVDLGGRIRFGPDAEYVERVRYDVDPAKADAFASAVRRYLPDLDARWLAPDFAGIRPRLAGPGEDFRDFVVAEESDAGLPGLVNLIGIESPGLTAAPAIAERVVRLLRG
jgi:L-2-hydroxyglutarate oxidase LhgO